MPSTDIIVPPPTAPVRLIMVTGDNNNKFYNMTPNGSQLVTHWGRVGVTETETIYPISKWASIYKSKVKKGYVDVTGKVKKTAKKSGHVDIPDTQIRALFAKLLSFARTSVQDNYTISSDAVTPIQVAEAQAIVDALTKMVKPGADKDKVNKTLLDLYTVIPRRMKKVQDHLIHTPLSTKAELAILRQFIDSEQKTLDVMAGQVQMAGADASDDDSTPARTILDALGITVECGDAKDEAVVRKFMADRAGELRGVYRVTHGTSRKLYERHLSAVNNDKAAIFWHGSRNENWISILQTGLKIRPSNAILNGSMFGDGIYFADKYQKSAGYSSLAGSHWTRGNANTAFLALLDVHLGKQLEVTRHSHECYGFCKPVLEKKGGYHSVFAKGGYDLINNEYIVYDNCQSTIKYLIEVGR